MARSIFEPRPMLICGMPIASSSSISCWVSKKSHPMMIVSRNSQSAPMNERTPTTVFSIRDRRMTQPSPISAVRISLSTTFDAGKKTARACTRARRDSKKLNDGLSEHRARFASKNETNWFPHPASIPERCKPRTRWRPMASGMMCFPKSVVSLSNTFPQDVPVEDVRYPSTRDSGHRYS